MLLLLVFGTLTAAAQSRKPRARKSAICGNPLVKCNLDPDGSFQPFDLPFRFPGKSVIDETDPFYAVILKSVSVGESDCDTFVPESERLQAQAMFPDHKVFTDRCIEPGNLFYTNVAENHRIMAVYAGTTLAEAKRFLATVKATGKFPGANLRRMRIGENGT